MGLKPEKHPTNNDIYDITGVATASGLCNVTLLIFNHFD